MFPVLTYALFKQHPCDDDSYRAEETTSYPPRLTNATPPPLYHLLLPLLRPSPRPTHPLRLNELPIRKAYTYCGLVWDSQKGVDSITQSNQSGFSGSENRHDHTASFDKIATDHSNHNSYREMHLASLRYFLTLTSKYLPYSPFPKLRKLHQPWMPTRYS